jgi:hypothetical protein
MLCVSKGLTAHILCNAVWTGGNRAVLFEIASIPFDLLTTAITGSLLITLVIGAVCIYAYTRVPQLGPDDPVEILTDDATEATDTHLPSPETPNTYENQEVSTKRHCYLQGFAFWSFGQHTLIWHFVLP